jgi:hypothetical protein
MGRISWALVALLVACGPAPPVDDVQPHRMPAGCALPSGRMCDSTLGCVCDDNCNGCHFYPYCDGYSMTAKYCPTPLAHCTSAADCPQGQVCGFDPGCASPLGFCLKADPGPPQTITICDCDGKTIDAESLAFVNQPYQYVGACH